jgi:hypothetical protein
MAVNELPNGGVNKAVRLHRGHGDGHECVRDRVQEFLVLFFSTRFTADQSK